VVLSDAHKILVFGTLSVGITIASALFPPLALLGAVFVWVALKRWLYAPNSRTLSVTAGILGAIFAAALLMVGATQMAQRGISGSEFAVVSLPLYATLGALIAFTTVGASIELRADGKRGIYPLLILALAAGLGAWFLLIAPSQTTRSDGRLESTDYIPENYCLTGSRSAYKEVKLHKNQGQSLDTYRQDRAANPVGPAAPGAKDCAQPIRYILYP
jgi:phosphate/sulfate permease